ncbi:MAG: pyruvate:ferredoxin (flavodoxin) oxidoreductase [Trueperaceae bacterium]
MRPDHRTLDGNEAVARVAYPLAEVIALYPITPSSPMGELADAWAQQGRPNLWNQLPRIVQMQSEGGAAGAIHGALQSGALTTTFTASQGLMLMLPNLYKIAGEATPAVIHVAARTVAAHALSIFGDHSDVMAARTTGVAMLFASSVQEAHDLALISQMATLAGRLPFLNVMDGFRTSHEVQRIAVLSRDDLRALIDDAPVRTFRQRALSPDRPVIRGTAQNPDVYFQGRERAEPLVRELVGHVEAAMDRFAERTGRSYAPFVYHGSPDAERVLIVMGSAADTARETVDWARDRGEKVGVVVVHLFRPFAMDRLLLALPPTTRRIAVLDRTKEAGSAGEPLLQDVTSALAEDAAAETPRFARLPRAVGVRYGLAGKELTPAMLIGLFAELDAERPRARMTLGIDDDLSGSSVRYDPSLDTEPSDVRRAVFWGLGSDGTVGAVRNAARIVGEGADRPVQASFVFDSKKAGARTVSHLRLSNGAPIRSAYLIGNADLVGVHAFGFLQRYDVLEPAAHGATVLLNAPGPVDTLWERLPDRVRRTVQARDLKLFAIDATALAAEHGLDQRVGTVMQTCWFELARVLPEEEARERLRTAVQEAYGKAGPEVVRKNLALLEAVPGHLLPVPVPPAQPGDADDTTAGTWPPTDLPDDAPEFVRDVTSVLLQDRGDTLPVSKMPLDGTWPLGTAAYEKRNLAPAVPVWDEDLCIQCGKCVLVCPHAAIRASLAPEEAFADAPSGFVTAEPRFQNADGMRYTLQVAVEDCTGCTLCVEACPARDKSAVHRKALRMEPQGPLRDKGRRDWSFFTSLPGPERGGGARFADVKRAQLLLPMFEFSGACAGCGETPYVKLLSQLFGDRSVIANATGCSSIYGGNLPTTPWTVTPEGFGPAWSNSLFEDNAEFGLGMRLAIDAQASHARTLLRDPALDLSDLAEAFERVTERDDAAVIEARRLVREVRARLRDRNEPSAHDLRAIVDRLVPTDVWILGGDGWAYDIGYGGLDHVLASGQDVNVLVLDTEVYSNTGGQASKATGMGAVAKFAAGGKRSAKKDLARMAMSYDGVYVATVAMGANDGQTVRAFVEAQAHKGPSLIVAYSHCIAHGIDMADGMGQQKRATASGAWPLFRYDPARVAAGKPGLKLDSRKPSIPFREYALRENRYRLLARTAPDDAERVLDEAERAIVDRWHDLERAATEPATPATTEEGPAR